jgi:hypothetical protein
MKIPYPRSILSGVLACAAAGCFYPPARKPPDDTHDRVVLAIPFDLAWDAVHTVIADNAYRIIAEDPNNGIIETQAAGGFTLKDADCGKLSAIALQYAAEPTSMSSAVYNFAIKPHGNEATVITLQAVFTSPLQVPIHPMAAEQCVSRGVEEARILKAIEKQARQEHRPEFKPPAG